MRQNEKVEMCSEELAAQRFAVFLPACLFASTSTCLTDDLIGCSVCPSLSWLAVAL